MGGLVALAIRKNGRTTIRQVPKWHGAIPTLSAFPLGGYGQDRGFDADWKRGVNMPLAPKHYGLVIIDHDTQWCGSCSDYGGLHEASFQLNRDYQVDDLVQLRAQGRVQGLALATTTGVDIPIKLPKASAAAKDIFAAVAKTGADPDNSTLFAELSPPDGWTFEDFNPEEPQGWKGLMHAMQARGFEVTDQHALCVWDEFFHGKGFEDNPADAWRAGIQAQELDGATRGIATASRRRAL